MLIRTRLFAALTSSICLLCPQLFPIGATYLRAEETGTGANRLTAAKQTKVALEQWDDRFAGEQRRLIDALDKAVLNVPSGSATSDFSNEREVLLLYVSVTDQLIKECDTVLTAQQKYLEIGHQYANNLASAGPTFTAAAAQCREFAAEEPYDDTRQDYLLMADIFESLAARCEQLPNKISPQVQAVEELHPYLQKGRQVLVRFQDVLQAIPVLKSDAEFDALDKRLKSYVQSYEKFRGSLRQLQQRLQSDRPAESNLNMARFRPTPAGQVQFNRQPTPTFQFTNGRPSSAILARPASATQLTPTPSLISNQPSTFSGEFLDDRVRPHSTTNAANRQLSHVLAFRGKAAYGDYIDADGWCRAQVVSSTVEVGDVFRVENHGGKVRTVRVLSEVPKARTNNSRLWYAELAPAENYRVISKFAMQE